MAVALVTFCAGSLLGVGEKKDTKDEYNVFATGVIAPRAGVGGGSYRVLFRDGVAAG